MTSTPKRSRLPGVGPLTAEEHARLWRRVEMLTDVVGTQRQEIDRLKKTKPKTARGGQVKNHTWLLAAVAQYLIDTVGLKREPVLEFLSANYADDVEPEAIGKALQKLRRGQCPIDGLRVEPRLITGLIESAVVACGNE